jgi:WhiB family redox-sensing transcriptional regulator
MSPTTIDNSPSGPGCTLSGIHDLDSTTGINTSEARHYLRRLFASWLPDWHDEATCRGHDPGPWFPTRGQSNQAALDICGRCPVRSECLAEALDDPTLDYGVRAGATANARKTMRRNRQRHYTPATEVGP